MKNKGVRPDLMKVEEVADRLGKNHNTIREWIISGKCKFADAVKVDKEYSYVIPRRRFEKWVSGADMNPIVRIRLTNQKKYKISKRV